MEGRAPDGLLRMTIAIRRVFPPLSKTRVEVLQVNLGRLCNQACLHCHVDSSPARTGEHENAQAALADQLLTLLDADPMRTGAMCSTMYRLACAISAANTRCWVARAGRRSTSLVGRPPCTSW